MPITLVEAKHVLGGIVWSRHCAVLARQIADLTIFRLALIAGRDLTSIERIEVAIGGRAVAIRAHGQHVYMVDFTIVSKLSSEIVSPTHEMGRPDSASQRC